MEMVDRADQYVFMSPFGGCFDVKMPFYINVF